MADPRPPFPASKANDTDDVRWALETGLAMWTQGDSGDALRWLRRAAENASEAEDDLRSLDLAKAGAELRGYLQQLEEEPGADGAGDAKASADPTPATEPDAGHAAAAHEDEQAPGAAAGTTTPSAPKPRGSAGSRNKRPRPRKATKGRPPPRRTSSPARASAKPSSPARSTPPPARRPTAPLSAPPPPPKGSAPRLAISSPPPKMVDAPIDEGAAADKDSAEQSVPPPKAPSAPTTLTGLGDAPSVPPPPIADGAPRATEASSSAPTALELASQSHDFDSDEHSSEEPEDSMDLGRQQSNSEPPTVRFDASHAEARPSLSDRATVVGPNAPPAPKPSSMLPPPLDAADTGDGHHALRVSVHPLEDQPGVFLTQVLAPGEEPVKGSAEAMLVALHPGVKLMLPR